MKRFMQAVAKGLSYPFHIPNNVNLQYRTGRQPYSPGETQEDSGGPSLHQIPWPSAAIMAFRTHLASNPGIPRDMALAANNNSTSSTPNNGLFIAGIASKSRG